MKFVTKKTNIVVTVVYIDDTFFCELDMVILDEIKSKFMTK